MKTKHFILMSIILLITFNTFANELINNDINGETDEIFTAKDKDFLQLWHYDQVLKMNLSEEDRDAYLERLNTHTFKMSSLGLSKYSYTDTERKYEFDKLVKKLDRDMKNTLSSSNYNIHQETFDKIESVIYDKRNWEE